MVWKRSTLSFSTSLSFSSLSFFLLLLLLFLSWEIRLVTKVVVGWSGDYEILSVASVAYPPNKISAFEPPQLFKNCSLKNCGTSICWVSVSQTTTPKRKTRKENESKLWKKILSASPSHPPSLSLFLSPSLVEHLFSLPSLSISSLPVCEILSPFFRALNIFLPLCLWASSSFPVFVHLFPPLNSLYYSSQFQHNQSFPRVCFIETFKSMLMKGY